MSAPESVCNPLSANTSGDDAAPHGPQHVPATPADGALARVVAAWDELPEAIRAAVLLLVDSAGKRP
jgi:hypothetical protein